MKKILHIQLLPLLSGVQRVTLDELDFSDKNKYEHLVLLSGEGPFTDELIKRNIRFVVVPSLCRKISLKNDIISLFKIIKLIRNEKNIDIVHTHSSKTGFLGRLAARIAGVRKIVHTVHGFAFPFATTKIEKYLYYFLEFLSARITDNLIVMNFSDYQLANKKLLLKKEKIHLLNNGVDLSGFSFDINKKSESRELINIKHNQLAIIMVGRLSKQKNPEILLNAISKLDNNVVLHFVGDGELKSSLCKRVDELQLNDRVVFHGWRKDVRELIWLFDLFVLPSRWEGMPLAILEAQSSKVPVLVSDIESNAYLIEKTGGMLFKSENVDSLVEQLNFFIQNIEYYKSVALNSYSVIENEFSLTKRINHLNELYLNK